MVACISAASPLNLANEVWACATGLPGIGLEEFLHFQANLWTETKVSMAGVYGWTSTGGRNQFLWTMPAELSGLLPFTLEVAGAVVLLTVVIAYVFTRGLITHCAGSAPFSGCGSSLIGKTRWQLGEKGFGRLLPRFVESAAD